ncbi:MAG: SPOR domain-containing protein [Gammaproteobacteria bacterium]
MFCRALTLAAILFSSVAYADSFDVQIGAFRNPDVANIVLPANVGELRSTSGPDGLTRFVVGPFFTRVDAEQARDRLKDSGFNGAFIRSTQDTRTVARESAYVSDSSDSNASYTINDTSTSTTYSDQYASDGDGDVVYLDGKLHRKVGDQFVPIRE